MKQIILSQGKVALVDDSDFEWLNQWKWHATKRQRRNGFVWYARRLEAVTRQAVYLHRQIAAVLGLSDVDHRDGNGLHNWRKNLRPCTRSQNLQNACKQLGRFSRFKGVTWHRQNQKWMAQIMFQGRNVYLGLFNSEREAAQAYDAASKRLFGEFANNNQRLLLTL